MIFERDLVAAEPFFLALLALHPFWTTGWIITSVYYANREIFHMADKINECIGRSETFESLQQPFLLKLDEMVLVAVCF